MRLLLARGFSFSGAVVPRGARRTLRATVAAMGLGRRKIKLDDATAWVFNRMAREYDARPPYPTPLIDALVALASGPGGRVLDVGAGIGHLALPLAARGLAVTAVEPAIFMLERLQDAARQRALPLAALHGQAEALPVVDACAELVVIADAMHFLDAELTGRELARVLVPKGSLGLVTCEFADTPFMRELGTIMAESAPRRPRAIDGAVAQLSALAGVVLSEVRQFIDETPLDARQLERILRTISFIGPAMNDERFEVFKQRVLALPQPVWSRRFTLRSGQRA